VDDKLVNGKRQAYNAFIDLRPNWPRTKTNRQVFRRQLREELAGRLEESVDRIWRLPPFGVEYSDVHVELLVEARELFVQGHFYPCVAMCGIAAERLIKDLLRGSLLLDSVDGPRKPTDGTFDQLERVELFGIVMFLREAELLPPGASKAALDLLRLRNKYAHARGKQPEIDAGKAVAYLQTVVEATISIFRFWETTDGVSWARKAEGAK
jgi:hypothetical protein